VRDGLGNVATMSYHTAMIYMVPQKCNRRVEKFDNVFLV
jgi:hypothetical protein